MIEAASNPFDTATLLALLRHAEQENDLLREQIRLLRLQIYGRRSESGRALGGHEQLPLFNEPEGDGEAGAEESASGAEKEEAIEQIRHLYAVPA